MKKVNLEDFEAVIKTVIELEYFQLNRLVESVYGGSFEFEAIEEATQGHYEYNMLKLSPVTDYDKKKHDKVRSGKYPLYCTSNVLHCLIEDGVIPNGIYMINNNH